MEVPLFTIITATFNAGEALAATAASVAGQPASLEHLIVDGGSTDGTRERAEALAAVDPRVRVLSEPDRGVYDAMNKGLRLARGRYLYFLGAGDTLRPGSLADVARRLPAGDGPAVIYGDVLTAGVRYAGRFSRRKLCVVNLCQQAVFYSRSAAELAGAFDLRYPALADWAYNMRLFGDGRVRTLYVPVVVANFELGGLSTQVVDAAFEADRPALARRYFGTATYASALPALAWQRFDHWARVTSYPFRSALRSAVRRRREGE